MKDILYTFDLQMFSLVSSGANATVQSGSTGTGTTNSDLAPEMKTYYDKKLIKTAQANLVHQQFGQKRPIPSESGKTIEFRKFSSLGKALTPISEGITPDGQVLNVTNITATVDQYGGWVMQTDMLELTAIDNTIYEATELLGQQAGLTIDTIVRNVLQGGTNVLYAPKVSGSTRTAVSGRGGLDATSKLTVRELKRAVATLRAANAPTFDGYYKGVIHPYNSFELMNDPEWEEVANYAAPENREAGEIGRIAGVKFVESSEAKYYAPAVISDGKNILTVKTANAEASTSLVINEELTAGSSLNIKCYINGVENKITAITTTSHVSTLTLQTAVTAAVGDVICGQGAAGDGSPVFSTLIFGKNAYGVTEVEGGGMEVIVKQKGSAGTGDPLNQRSSVGWKALVTAEILVPEYLIALESTSDEFAIAASN